MSAVAAARITLSTLVAGLRSAAGHRPGHQSAADTGMASDTNLATYAGHQLSGRWSFRKQRTVNPRLVTTFLLFLKAGPALAGHVRASGV
jgi:hypothetical protein